MCTCLLYKIYTVGKVLIRPIQWYMFQENRMRIDPLIMRTIYTIKSSEIQICLCYILAIPPAEPTRPCIQPNDVYMKVPVRYEVI